MAEVKKEHQEAQKLFLEHNIFIVWKGEYNLGIPIIDEHHKGIVSIINSLHFGMQNRYVKDILSPIIDMMNDYTRIHFKIEEDFLSKIDFPHAKSHNEMHLDLYQKLRKMGRDSILHNDSSQFLDFLKNWWIHHICHEDLIFRNFLFKEGEHQAKRSP